MALTGDCLGSLAAEAAAEVVKHLVASVSDAEVTETHVAGGFD
jgi:hypothetical protein